MRNFPYHELNTLRDWKQRAKLVLIKGGYEGYEGYEDGIYIKFWWKIQECLFKVEKV